MVGSITPININPTYVIIYEISIGSEDKVLLFSTSNLAGYSAGAHIMSNNRTSTLSSSIGNQDNSAFTHKAICKKSINSRTVVTVAYRT